MRYADAIRELKAAADPQIATIYDRRNPGMHTIGVRFADLDRIAKATGKDHALAVKLWASGIMDARLLACKVEVPAEMTKPQITAQLKDLDFPTLADLFAANVYRTQWAHSLMKQWTRRKGEFTRRCGFALVYAFAADPDSGITDEELLDYLEQIGQEIHSSANWAREAMNMAPIAIGKGHPKLAKRALATAKAVGAVEVFHGDRTNCKIWNAADALNDPKVKLKLPA